MRLFTSRYQRYAPGHGAPVRATFGYPRFKLTYELVGVARLIAPTEDIFSLRYQYRAFQVAYRAHLAAAGVEAIRGELERITDAARNDRLVLLCFCDLSAPGGWCHRRMFADWWHKHTGQDVPELAEPAPRSLFD